MNPVMKHFPEIAPHDLLEGVADRNAFVPRQLHERAIVAMWALLIVLIEASGRNLREHRNGASVHAGVRNVRQAAHRALGSNAALDVVCAVHDYRELWSRVAEIPLDVVSTIGCRNRACTLSHVQSPPQPRAEHMHVLRGCRVAVAGEQEDIGTHSACTPCVHSTNALGVTHSVGRLRRQRLRRRLNRDVIDGDRRRCRRL